MFQKKCENIYIAIIGDIINSKKIDERNRIQEKLKKILNEINYNYPNNIVSNFMITLGDEFQGLLTLGSEIFRIISFIEMEMHPIKIRFGIGIGEITTEINRDFPLGSDGPAYYNARDMIYELKKLERKYESYNANIMIKSDIYNSETIELINSILTLCTTIKGKWTERQYEIIKCYLENDENQHLAAQSLAINQSSVNKSLNNSGFYNYWKAISNLISFLDYMEK
ncbi:MAG: hypothetical protein A2Y17_09060 [Clostridiales bacterium GWF2_38_85]|nr:MAG: hypothetical protein A2Y17_09060 [Clostridiales bacterium GWF2_38_85]HBL83654.1 hypothetical protein [Clostridiales bacterium]